MALTTTLSGSTSDSYVTVAEADTFFANHYTLAKSSAWSLFSTPQKEMLLVRACQVIESLPLEDSVIYRHLPDQVLTFPRNTDYDTLGAYYVPPAVKDAQCEQAIYLSALDESAIADQIQGIKFQGIGGGMSVQTSYVGLGSVVAPMAFALLSPLLRRSRRLRRA